jgi:predicted small integral membrane protein
MPGDEESAVKLTVRSLPRSASAIKPPSEYSIKAERWNVNFGFWAVSKVFASQFSWAAKACDVEPTSKMPNTAKARTDALFTMTIVFGAVINLSWSMKIAKKIQTKFYIK